MNYDPKLNYMAALVVTETVSVSVDSQDADGYPITLHTSVPAGAVVWEECAVQDDGRPTTVNYGIVMPEGTVTGRFWWYFGFCGAVYQIPGLKPTLDISPAMKRKIACASGTIGATYFL